MPHLTVLGTQSPATGSDPHRITGGGRDHVTRPIRTAPTPTERAFRTSPGLLAGRYLHTNSTGCGSVSIALVENGPQAAPHSNALLGLARVNVGSERSGRRTRWLAAALTVCEGLRATVVQVATPRHNEGVTEPLATISAERSAISMARTAPSDIGVAEVHDSFTPAELISYEEGGLAEPAAVSAVTIPEGPVTDGR
jgi:hypothetical protein